MVPPILPFPFLTFPSYPFLSFPILCYHFLSFPILSYPFLSLLILSYPFLSFPILPFPILSFPILSHHFVSFPILPYPNHFKCVWPPPALLCHFEIAHVVIFHNRTIRKRNKISLSRGVFAKVPNLLWCRGMLKYFGGYPNILLENPTVSHPHT